MRENKTKHVLILAHRRVIKHEVKEYNTFFISHRRVIKHEINSPLNMSTTVNKSYLLVIWVIFNKI